MKRNEIITNGTGNISEMDKTPIEILLGIDDEGKTTAKKLYEFLELNPVNYARWFKSNVLGNAFATENVDFWPFSINEENLSGGRPTQDAKLTAAFAKKLSNLYYKRSTSISFDVMDKLCDNLHCAVGDLFQQQKDFKGRAMR